MSKTTSILSNSNSIQIKLVPVSTMVRSSHEEMELSGFYVSRYDHVIDTAGVNETSFDRNILARPTFIFFKRVKVPKFRPPGICCFFLKKKSARMMVWIRMAKPLSPRSVNWRINNFDLELVSDRFRSWILR